MVQVTCGSYHTAAVTSDGSLYTWGGGMYGKLGHGNETGCSTPKRVEGLVGLCVAQIACGSRHTVVVTSTGAAFSWGDMENGRDADSCRCATCDYGFCFNTHRISPYPGVAGHGATEGHQYNPRVLERLAGKSIVQLSVRS